MCQSTTTPLLYSSKAPGRRLIHSQPCSQPAKRPFAGPPPAVAPMARPDGDGPLADPARRRSTCARSRHGQDKCLAGRDASGSRLPQAGPAQRGHLR
jgi:hypothetical protein